MPRWLCETTESRRKAAPTSNRPDFRVFRVFGGQNPLAWSFLRKLHPAACIQRPVWHLNSPTFFDGAPTFRSLVTFSSFVIGPL